MHAFGQLIVAISGTLAPLGLAGHFAVARLDTLLLHGHWPVYVVQFVVEPAGIAHRVTIAVAPPKGGGGGLTVSAAGASSSRSGQSAFGLDERSVLAIHLVVQAASVAQVVTRPVPPPQGGGGGTAVDALAPL